MRIGPLLPKIGQKKVRLIVGVSALVLAGALIFDRPQIFKVTSFSQVRDSFAPSDVWILDRHGVPLESVREAKDHRTLEWTPWDEVSPSFQTQLIHTEDKRFYHHFGVDPLAIGQALSSAAFHGGKRGASTLTMQLVNLIAPPSGHGLKKKLQQIWTAVLIESMWSKREILEAYINLVPLRGELVGLRAASLGLFAKSPAALNEIEAALLIASIRSPNAPPELVVKRACRDLPMTECQTIAAIAQHSIAEPYRIQRSREHVPVLAKSFLRQDQPQNSHRPSGTINTTLEARIQDMAVEAAHEQMQELRERNVHDVAIVVLDTHSGEPLAYVGNGGPGFTSALQIDGAQTRRQAGSTLKAFVYATAFDMRLLTLQSLVEDSPEDISVGGGSDYNPRNYDHMFEGQVSAAEALASSLNVPAVRTVLLTKESRVLERMRSLGFQNLKDDDHYGPSLALGTVDVTLFELTNAYRQLSLFSDSKVFSPETKSQIFASLSLPDYRRFTFGLDSSLSLPFPAAVKTGTSKDMRDNWCLGYTSEYTVGVWVGNFDGASMWNVSGMTGAAPIWRKLMLALHPHPPRDPAMTYLPPNQPLVHRTLSRIRYPQAEMLISLDPDIPKRLQKLPIKIEHPQSGSTVSVDGRSLGAANEMTFWPLKTGRHRVELLAKNGQVLDDVGFVVR